MGAIFAIFAAFNFWFPVLTGLSLRRVGAKLHFLVMFLAVNISFFPQHFLGLAECLDVILIILTHILLEIKFPHSVD